MSALAGHLLSPATYSSKPSKGRLPSCETCGQQEEREKAKKGGRKVKGVGGKKWQHEFLRGERGFIGEKKHGKNLKHIQHKSKHKVVKAGVPNGENKIVLFIWHEEKE